MSQEMIANRHRGNLKGCFEDTRLPARVTLILSAEVAHHPVAQHLCWMLVNLLARQAFEIREIELAIPAGIAPVERLSPLISGATDLRVALREGISRIHPDALVPKTTVQSRVSIRVGPGPLGDGDCRLATTAYGWSGYVGRVPADILGNDEHPIGAYIAASLCAGETFKFVRGMKPEAGSFAQQLWLDAASFHVSSEAPTLQGPILPKDLRLTGAVVAGIGAVGNGLLHTLYPLANLQGELHFIDGDPEGIDETNLNRYVLFGLEHISALKASTASEMFAKSQIVAHPVDESWQAWYAANSNTPLNVVISAVDKNSARHAIQAAMPRFVLGASTNEMRVLVNFFDVFHGGPCLRCGNPVEEAVPDDVLIAQLRTLSEEERLMRAQRIGVAPSALEAFLTDPQSRCGMINGETLQKFASKRGSEEWSVGFVSLLAGVLLAAEYLKLSIGPGQTSLNAQQNTFRFQFWCPESDEVNKVVSTPPEAMCFCQTPTFQQALLHFY